MSAPAIPKPKTKTLKWVPVHSTRLDNTATAHLLDHTSVTPMSKILSSMLLVSMTPDFVRRAMVAEVDAGLT
jgi:hypothetical protein